MKKLALVLAVVAAAGTASAQKKAAKVVLADEVKWVEMPNTGGVNAADLWGKRDKGRHGSFTKFKGGWESPLHTHNARVRITVISGTYIFGDADGNKKELGPGSFVQIPSKLKHTSACKAGADCVVLSIFNKKFNLKPVKGAAPPAPKAEDKKTDEPKKSE